MKNKILIITAIFLFVNNANGQFAELVAKKEKAIVQILSYDEYGAPSSSGTGFFIKPDGTGLTNVHVLEDAKYAFVQDIKGNIFQINKITRICEECDIAEFTVLANGKTFPIITQSDKIPLKGSDIFVIGNPEGYESTVSKGIVSAIREENEKVVQISAPISPGSSGSPIMDMNGNVFAIATYQHRDGQNLNFGYWIGCREKLIPNTKYKLSNDRTNNLYIINQICKTESGLILNSIEVNEKNTVLNLTFTNTSLTFGDNAFIYTTIGNNDKSFYIQDKLTKKKYYLYDATIGISPKDPTYLKLGESIRFKLFFPAIGNIKEFDIAEGMQGSDWSFSDINLISYKNFNFSNKNFFNDFYYQTGLAMLSEKEFASAYRVLKEFASKNNDNDFAHNLAGIVSYTLGNNLDAFLHIKKAIQINPTNDNYYFNLYHLHKEKGEINDALKCISSAIQLNSDQPEYYSFRGDIYIEKKYWKEAIIDYDKYINSDRDIPAHAYFQRGYAKLWLNDNSACKDIEEAYKKEEDEEAKKSIEEWYNKFCK
jgi:serine protease Do